MRSRPIAPAAAGLGTKSPGFTLIELLVAITIMSIVAIMGWRGLDSIIRARQSLQANLEQTRGIQLAFAQMESDAANIAEAEDIPGLDSFFLGPNDLLMVRRVQEENQPGRIQIVAYRLREGVLSRSESLATRELAQLRDDWQRFLAQADTVSGIPLQSQVAAMNLRSWRQGETDWRSPGVDNIAPSPNGGAGSRGKPGRWSGLEVSLRLQSQSQPMLKIVLLGAS